MRSTRALQHVDEQLYDSDQDSTLLTYKKRVSEAQLYEKTNTRHQEASNYFLQHKSQVSNRRVAEPTPKRRAPRDSSVEYLPEKSEKRTKNAPEGLATPSKKIAKRVLSGPVQMRRTWTKQEDEQLLSLIKVYGQNWSMISQSMGGSRNGKQIRDRYLNKLNPSIKNTKWTPEEDQKLLKLYSIHGRKWCRISKELIGRTEAMVKNRFYTKFENQIEENGNLVAFQKESSEELEDLDLYQSVSQGQDFSQNKQYHFEVNYSQYVPEPLAKNTDPYQPELNMAIYSQASKNIPEDLEHMSYIDLSAIEKANQRANEYSETQSQMFPSNGGSCSNNMEIEESVLQEPILNDIEGPQNCAPQVQEDNNGTLDKQSQIKLLESRLSEVEKIFWSTLDEIRRIVNSNNAANIKV